MITWMKTWCLHSECAGREKRLFSRVCCCGQCVREREGEAEVAKLILSWATGNKSMYWKDNYNKLVICILCVRQVSLPFLNKWIQSYSVLPIILIHLQRSTAELWFSCLLQYADAPVQHTEVGQTLKTSLSRKFTFWFSLHIRSLRPQSRRAFSKKKLNARIIQRLGGEAQVIIGNQY